MAKDELTERRQNLVDRVGMIFGKEFHDKTFVAFVQPINDSVSDNMLFIRTKVTCKCENEFMCVIPLQLMYKDSRIVLAYDGGDFEALESSPVIVAEPQIETLCTVCGAKITLDRDRFKYRH